MVVVDAGVCTLVVVELDTLVLSLRSSVAANFKVKAASKLAGGKMAGSGHFRNYIYNFEVR